MLNPVEHGHEIITPAWWDHRRSQQPLARGWFEEHSFLRGFRHPLWPAFESHWNRQGQWQQSCWWFLWGNLPQFSSSWGGPSKRFFRVINTDMGFTTLAEHLKREELNIRLNLGIVELASLRRCCPDVLRASSLSVVISLLSWCTIRCNSILVRT